MTDGSGRQTPLPFAPNFSLKQQMLKMTMMPMMSVMTANIFELLGTRHRAKISTCLISSNPHSNPMRWVWLLSPFFRWRSWDLDLAWAYTAREVGAKIGHIRVKLQSLCPKLPADLLRHTADQEVAVSQRVLVCSAAQLLCPGLKSLSQRIPRDYSFHALLCGTHPPTALGSLLALAVTAQPHSGKNFTVIYT